MKKLNTGKKFYMICVAAALLMAIAVFIVYFCFAWYAQNTAVTASGMFASVNADTGMEFTDTVTATHYKLTGDVVTYTYKKETDGTLTLTKKVTKYYDKTKKDEEVTSFTDKSYLIDSILPDEYIDVTIGFYLTDDSLKDKGYTITLTDFAFDEENTFELSGLSNTYSNYDKTYGVLPAFKWRTVSKVGEDDTSTTEYTFFHGEYSSSNTSGGFFYYVSKDDSDYSVPIASGTWDEKNVIGAENYSAIPLTFRIKEDFSEYYKIFEKTDANYFNYLSNKIMQMEIHLAAKETKT